MSKSYWQCNGFTKRINSFSVYLVCAIASLFIPEATDTILYKVLKEQFDSKPKE